MTEMEGEEEAEEGDEEEEVWRLLMGEDDDKVGRSVIDR